MMSCTVHSPTDSLVQPACILVYIECNPAPGGSPFKLSLGLRSKLPSPIHPLPSEFVCVGSWSFGLGSPHNVMVGDIVEVARGKWYHCQGVVNVVDFTEACIEMVCLADGNRVSYTFSSLILTLIFWPR